MKEMRRPASTVSLTFIAPLIFSACLFDGRASSGSQTAANDQAAFAQLEKRTVSLPVIHSGDQCPITKGSRESVPRESYIFCSGCLWFGAGPVYFAWSFKVKDEANAVFSLDSVPRQDNAYIAKVPWVSKPDYAGPILVRGRQLDGNGKIRFYSGSNRQDELRLNAPMRNDETHWSFWPTSLSVPRNGCYGIQVDTQARTDVVIFSATTGK